MSEFRRSLASMKRKGGERTRAKMVGKNVMIWSAEWRAWWRPDRAGYTKNPIEAGVYTFDEAWRVSQHCDPRKGIQYVACDKPVTQEERP